MDVAGADPAHFIMAAICLAFSSYSTMHSKPIHPSFSLRVALSNKLHFSPTLPLWILPCFVLVGWCACACCVLCVVCCVLRVACCVLCCVLCVVCRVSCVVAYKGTTGTMCACRRPDTFLSPEVATVKRSPILELQAAGDMGLRAKTPLKTSP